MKYKFLSSKIKRLLNELDWDCQDHLYYKTSLNIVHWYPASFITSIPGNIIDIFTEPGDKIWDPFCGCGTSALESFRKGRHFYGNDVCEIAVLISLAKLSLLKFRKSVEIEFKKIILDMKKLDFDLLFNISHKKFIEKAISTSSYEELKPWYNKRTLRDLLLLKGFLEEYEKGQQFKTTFQVIFQNVAKLACAQQKTWGHIADNVRPNITQISKNNYNVLQSFIRKLIQIQNQVNKIPIISNKGKYQIKVEDAKYYSPPSLVDIIVTSPPYPSMADYVTSQRLDYYWRGYTSKDINKLKRNEIGARFLRHNRQRNQLYLDGIKQCFNNVFKYLKEGGLIVIVLPEFDNSDSRKSVIDKIYNYFSTNLELEYSTKRNMDENNRWAPFKKLKQETLTIWSKK